MKNKYPHCIDTHILIARRQLLKYIHVGQLYIEVGRKRIANPNGEPVLIEIVIHNLFSGIDVKFIVEK